jgi:5-formyltetrahydrofolate cyclo-ligase
LGLRSEAPDTGKQDLRERVWDALGGGDARFPFPPHGRITNFAGAREAADRLAATAAWREAGTPKANPDAPQLPARRRALHEGKTVYMAVPRLRDADPFHELDPGALDDLDAAPTVSSVATHAWQVGPDALPDVDIVLCGSVAVTADGARVGKDGVFSDLEWAVLAELGAVDEGTVVATGVHERQVVEDAPGTAQDVPVDLVVTPERVVRIDTEYDRLTGIDWSALDGDRRNEMPLLADLSPSDPSSR